MNEIPINANDQFMHNYETALENAAVKKGAAESLDELRKIIFSELVNQSNAPSIAKAEHWARDHERYRTKSAEAMNAKTEAHIAEARAKGMSARLDIWRTRNATERAKMQML